MIGDRWALLTEQLYFWDFPKSSFAIKRSFSTELFHGRLTVAQAHSSHLWKCANQGPLSTKRKYQELMLFKSWIHHLNLNISCQVISQVKYFGQSHCPPMHGSHLMSIFVSVLTRFETPWKFKHLDFWPTTTFCVKSMINLLFPPLSSRRCMQATLVTVVTRIL